MSFETKRIALFCAKSRCFLPCLRSPAKAMWYANETLSFQDSAIRSSVARGGGGYSPHWPVNQNAE